MKLNYSLGRKEQRTPVIPSTTLKLCFGYLAKGR